MSLLLFVMFGCLDADAILDPDGDGVDWPDDCRSDDPDLYEITTFYPDTDGDGYGDGSSPVEACVAPSQHVDNARDCDDVDESRHPEAVEVCDNIDNDCDELIDDEDDDVQREVEVQVFADVDDDGFGDPGAPSIACAAGGGFVEDDSDCDDTDPSVNPNAQEICDSIDNDCDELIDNDDNSTDFHNTGAVFYKDEDKDGFGDPARPEERCMTDEWHVDNSDDCDDSADTVFPGADEVCGDGVVNDCDGDVESARAECSLFGALAATDATTRFSGRFKSSGAAGLALRYAGDLDGDGLSDLLIGAPLTATAGGGAEGEAYIHLGPSSVDVTLGDPSTHMTIGGVTTSGYLGHSLAGVGDLNGDGVNDVLLGSYPTDTVHVFTAVVAGVVTVEAATFNITRSTGGAFGTSIAGPGDVDGDGLADLLMGAPGASAAYLVYGSADVSDTELDVATELEGRGVSWSSTRYAEVGASVALVDVLGDGRDDIVLGSSDFGVYVVEASTVGTSDDLDAVAITMDLSTTLNVGIPNVVENANDVDGDGREDLLVGVPGAYDHQGIAYLFTGGAALSGPTDAHATFVTSTAGTFLGVALAGVGDLDGDGQHEVLISAAPSTISDSDEDGNCDGGCDGAVYLFYGPISGTIDVADADATFLGGEDAWLGRSIAGVGDTNGDGLSDILIGAPGLNADGEALLFLGAGY